MTRLVAVALAGALLGGCARCGKPTAPAAHVKRSIDLRSALMLTFPETRGARAEGTARLTRTMSGASDWPTELAHAMAHNNFSPDSDGGVGGVRPPFRVDLVKDGPTADLAVTMALDTDAVDRVYQAPFAITTLELGLFLPRREGLVTEREIFELDLRYVASEARAAFLTRQLIDLSLANGQWTHRDLPDAGWDPDRKPDGGFGGVPEKFEVILDGKTDGATITVRRDGTNVEVKYTLVTDEPKR